MAEAALMVACLYAIARYMMTGFITHKVLTAIGVILAVIVF